MKEKSKPEGRKKSAMSRHQKILIALAGAFLLYSVIGFMVLPAVLKNILEKKLAENLKRAVAIKAIQINPYSLKVTVNGFMVEDRDQKSEFIGFDQLFIDLEAVSLFKRALVIREITLTGPRASLSRHKDLSYNFSDIGAARDETEKTESSPLFFSLNNIAIKNGSVVFADEPKETTHRVTDINITVPYLSNVLHEVDIHTEPAFSAIVDATPVKMSGRTIPFHESRRTVFDIQFAKLEIPRYLAYFPDLGNLTLKSGQLDIRLELGFELQPGKIPALTLDGDISLHGIDIAELAGESYLKIPQLDLKLLESRPLEKNFHLANITLSSPEFLLRRKKDGVVSPFDLLPASGEEKKPEPPADRENGLKLHIDEIALNSGTVHFEDQANSMPFATTLNPVELKISNLSTLEDAEAAYEVSLKTEAEESVAVNGTLSLTPLATQLHISLQELIIPRFSPYFADIVTVQVKEGSLDLAADLHFSKPAETVNIRIDNIAGQLSSLAVNDKDNAELLTIPSLMMTDGSVDPGERRIVLGDLTENGGRLHLVREQDGALNLAGLMRQEPAAAGPEPVGAAAGEWQATLQKSSISDFKVIFRDNVPPEPTTIEIDNIRLAAANITTVKNSPGTVDLGLRLDGKGDFSAKGQISLKPLAADLSLYLAALPVKTVQPYFSDKVSLVISDGAISADAKLSLASGAADTLSVRFQGNAGVAGFSAFDPLAGEEFLKWQEFRLQGMEYDSNSSAFGIKEVIWKEFYNKIAVFEDGSVNLKAVLGSEDDSEAETPEPSAEKQTDAGEKSLLVEIGRVSLEQGRFDFLDNSITPHYSSSLSDITGTVTGLSSKAGVTGDVDISGRLDQHAPLKIIGRINPLSEELFADLTVDFKDIELSPTSPYTGKFIGYKIAKGKLSLELKYLVENTRINGKNNAFLDQFTLGDTVDSPDAVSLPINLAIALLKNRKDEITLNVPVKGDLADPEFSVGGVVFKAIINLIAKAATSPFALLGALIPEGGEDLQHIGFVPGSSEIGEEGAEKLATIAKVLFDRPGLKMDITGGVDAAMERDVLHEAAFEQLLKNEKFKELSRKKEATVSLDEITVEPEEFEEFLTQAYKEADFEKPKNVLGFNKRLPPEEMEKLLRDNITVTDDDLRLLAIQRANAVKSFLVDAGPVDPERLFIIEPREGAGETGTPQVEMTIK